MTCGQFEKRLHDLLDRRLAPSEDLQLARHARRCPACRETLAACTRMIDGLNLLELPVPDDGFSSRVLKRTPLCKPLRTGQARASQQRIGTAWAAGAAALALSLLLFVAWRADRRQAPSAPASLAAVLPDNSTAAPQTAERTGAILPQGLDRTSSLALASQQPWSLLLRWKETWSVANWSSVDGLADGLNPITMPLSVAVEEIRRTIPLSLVEPRPAPSADSARRPDRRDELPLV